VTVAVTQTDTENYWQWQDWRIHYVQKGEQGPCIVLLHGFGASTDHWRKNIDELSRYYRVWAVDMLGFGRSEKPNIDYTGDLWRAQVQAFCEEIVQEPVFIAGNSLGGYASLCFAVDCPQWTRGLILLNCAGTFTKTDPKKPEQSAWQQQWQLRRQQVMRSRPVINTMSYFLFNRMRKPENIRKALMQVYKDHTAVTDRLVEEIYRPSLDKGALGVFSGVFKSPPGRKLNVLLESLNRPLLLLWGSADPWMTPQKAEQFQHHYPQAELVLVDAGHCPHDECPEVVDAEMHRWIQEQG